MGYGYCNFGQLVTRVNPPPPTLRRRPLPLHFGGHAGGDYYKYMAEKQHLGTITILVKDRKMHAKDVQDILSKHGHKIMARLGVNVQPACIEHCTGLITVAVKGTMKEIKGITDDLDKLYGIVAKSSIMTE